MANIELDGANKKIKVDSGDLTLDVPGDIVLDADGGDVVVADGGTNILKVTNSSSDVVLQPQVDAKDIIFKQYDGTTVATVEDNGTFNIPTDKLAINGTAVTSTAAELNILDGVTSTASELNILDGVTSTASELNLLDGGTSVGSSITLADSDGFVVNDGGTMKTIPASDISTYAGGGNLILLGRSVNDDSGTSGGIQFNGIFTSTYRNYLLLIGKVAVETNTADLRVVLLDSSNNALTGSHYTRGGEYNDAGNNSVDEIQAIGTANWIIGPSSHNADSTPTHGSFHIFNNTHTTTNDRVFMTGTGIWHHEAQHDPRIFYFGGAYANAVHAAGIRIETSSGNISDHEISIFGIKAY